MYELDKEICVYNNKDELNEIINHLKVSPDDFKKITISGLKRTFNEHTYIHRMQKVLSYV